MDWFLLVIVLSSVGIQNVEILEVHPSKQTCVQRVYDAESLDPPAKMNFVCCPSVCEISSLVL